MCMEAEHGDVHGPSSPCYNHQGRFLGITLHRWDLMHGRSFTAWNATGPSQIKQMSKFVARFEPQIFMQTWCLVSVCF